MTLKSYPCYYIISCFFYDLVSIGFVSLIRIVSNIMSLITVESQKDYHARKKHHHSRTTTTTTTTTATAVATTTMRSPASMTATTAVEQAEDNQIPEVTKWPTTEPMETWEITTTTMSTTSSTTTTTTMPPRECKRTERLLVSFIKIIF